MGQNDPLCSPKVKGLHTSSDHKRLWFSGFFSGSIKLEKNEPYIRNVFVFVIRGSTCTAMALRIHMPTLSFSFLSFTFFPPEVPLLRMSPQPFSPMLLLFPLPASRFPLPASRFPLSVSMCRPRTGAHPSKYRPSAKLLDLGDRLAPRTLTTYRTHFELSYIMFREKRLDSFKRKN